MYGFLVEEMGNFAVTDRARRLVRPTNAEDRLAALREAVLETPIIGTVYNHYRGEYLPADAQFFRRTLIERFEVSEYWIDTFVTVFTDLLSEAHLLENHEERTKVIDIGRDETASPTAAQITPTTTATCFVMQPFASPYSGYYDTIFRPAIEKAGLAPIRADAEIFGAGRIMDQVWRGIRGAKVLVAELSTRNANVYYELGLAHALRKPIVLIAAQGEEVPFDIHHIRVVYYDVHDPFWGTKLIDKIAENVRSALANPEEAIFAIED